MKLDGFVIAIIGTVVFAFLFPQFGSETSNISLDAIASIGISLIFFFYGLKLSPEKLKAGLSNWKLHLLVQGSTFLLFPIIVLAVKPFIVSEQGEMIWLSFLFLAALPSTVSSSVVMTSIAKGNVPAAIFNASISGLIGIIVTPLWMGLFLGEQTSSIDMSSIYLQLATEILLPVVLGLLLQPYFGKFIQPYLKQLSLFDKGVILLIIYKSFAHSFEQHVFSSVDSSNLIVILLLTLILFWGVYFLTEIIAKKLHFTLEDKIVAQFCGTKKSLVHGTVFSKIIFPASFPVGIILLPLMLFHALQIFIISIIAEKLGKRKENTFSN
jgi:solute carrier family 10 (sodium/bile acid cotransporter), member 7